MSEGTAGETEERIALPAILDVAAATTLKDVLTAALAGGSSVLIEAADVQRASTPALQVLVAAASSFAQNGKTLRFGDCAPALHDAIDTLALGPALGFHGD